jgi:hypothetical protein
MCPLQRATPPTSRFLPNSTINLSAAPLRSAAAGYGER